MRHDSKLKGLLIEKKQAQDFNKKTSLPQTSRGTTEITTNLKRGTKKNNQQADRHRPVTIEGDPNHHPPLKIGKHMLGPGL